MGKVSVAPGRVLSHFLILYPHRAPSSPKNKLPWQLSPGTGRLRVDPLPGALLFFPHGAAAGPQGGATALPERWVTRPEPTHGGQVAPPLVGTQTHEYIPTLLSTHRQHLHKMPSCSHMRRPYMTLYVHMLPHTHLHTCTHTHMNPQTPHHPLLRLQRRGLGQLWGTLPPRRPIRPDVGLLCIQRVGPSCLFWMRWRMCLSGSTCRAMRARVGAPGWA